MTDTVYPLSDITVPSGGHKCRVPAGVTLSDDDEMILVRQSREGLYDHPNLTARQKVTDKKKKRRDEANLRPLRSNSRTLPEPAFAPARNSNNLLRRQSIDLDDLAPGKLGNGHDPRRSVAGRTRE